MAYERAAADGGDGSRARAHPQPGLLRFGSCHWEPLNKFTDPAVVPSGLVVRPWAQGDGRVIQIRSRLLSLLPPPDQEALAPHLRRHRLRRGDVIAQPGVAAEHIYFVESGIVAVLVPLDGRAVESCMVGKEGAINLIAAMGSGRLAARGVVEVEGHALCLGAKAWRSIAFSSEAFLKLSGRYAHASWLHALQLVACNSRHSVEQRFARKLMAARTLLERDEFRMTQSAMASSLGVHRTSVVGVASQFQSRQIIEYRHGAVRILRPDMLANAACSCFHAIGEAYRAIYLDQRIVPSR